MNTQPLFGGAMQCLVPADWRDVSDIRQVPVSAFYGTDRQACRQVDGFDRNDGLLTHRFSSGSPRSVARSTGECVGGGNSGSRNVRDG
eukprot:scaffold42784_cov214-Amphora_coffeaeformis.AAC.9